MKSTSVGNLNGSQFNRVKKFPWNSEGHEPVTVYEVVKDRVETRQFPRKSFFPIDVDSQPVMQQIQKQPSPVRKSHPSESEEGEVNCEVDQRQLGYQPELRRLPSPPHQQQPQQKQDTSMDIASLRMHSLLKRNQEEISYLKEQIKVKDAKICELEAIVKQLTLRN